MSSELTANAGAEAAQARFDRLCAAFADRPDVGLPDAARRGFGSDALKVNGSIFAMLTRGRLVVKLPEPRVRELIAGGDGEPFDAGKGKPMKEWVTVTGDGQGTWRDLTEEALAFVGRAHSR
jgi:hypothetical protein